MSVLLQLHLHSWLNTWLQWLGKDNCNTRRETFKFWNLVRFILEVSWQSILVKGTAAVSTYLCALKFKNKNWGFPWFTVELQKEHKSSNSSITWGYIPFYIFSLPSMCHQFHVIQYLIKYSTKKSSEKACFPFWEIMSDTDTLYYFYQLGYIFIYMWKGGPNC